MAAPNSSRTARYKAARECSGAAGGGKAVVSAMRATSGVRNEVRDFSQRVEKAPTKADPLRSRVASPYWGSGLLKQADDQTIERVLHGVVPTVDPEQLRR